MTTEEGTRELAHLTARAASDIVGFSDLLRHGDTMYMQHVEHGVRAAQVGASLQAVQTLAESGAAAPSFVLARTVMERWAIDSVILLGDRYVQLFRDTTRVAYRETVSRWESGELPSILERPMLIGKAGTTMRIVQRGLSAEVESDRVLHPLYFEIDRFDPFFGPPDEQQDLVGGALHGDPRRSAEEFRRTYNASLKWSAVAESLQLNSLVGPEHMTHLRVHYRFLSAFVHGHHTAYGALEPRLLRSSYSIAHVAEELALLYIAQFSARYMQALLRMADRSPRVEVGDRQRLGAVISELYERSRHLWFLDSAATPYDRGQELLDRAAKERSWGTKQDPASIPDTEIRYYRNPLERLARLHESSSEMATGFTYLSPW